MTRLAWDDQETTMTPAVPHLTTLTSDDRPVT